MLIQKNIIEYFPKFKRVGPDAFQKQSWQEVLVA